MTASLTRGGGPGPLDDAALEAALADLAGALVVPPTPDIATAVGSRLRRVSGTPRRGVLPRLTVRWALVAALVALLALTGVAIGFGFRLPGLEIIFVGPAPTPALAPTPAATAAPPAPPGVTPAVTGTPGPTPAPQPTRSATPLDLGTPATIEAVRAAVGFRLFLPQPAAVGDVVTAVYLDSRVRHGQVALVFAAGPGLPEASTAPVGPTGLPVGLIVTESLGRVDDAFLGKLVGPDTTVTEVLVNGNRGLWIAGRPHLLVILDDRGQARQETLRQVGNVLAWVQDGTLIRLEIGGGLDRALAVAASMR